MRLKNHNQLAHNDFRAGQVWNHNPSNMRCHHEKIIPDIQHTAHLVCNA